MKNKKNNSAIRMLKYFKIAKKQIIIILILEIVLCILEALNPIINANLLTSVTSFNAKTAIFLTVLLILTTLLNAVINRLCNIIYLKGIKKPVFISLRKDMIKNIFDMKTMNFDTHTSGEFSERLVGDPESISRMLNILQYNILTLIANLIILIYVYYINYIIGIIYTISVIVIYEYEKYAYKKHEELVNETRKISEKNSSLLNEIMRGIRDIKLLNIMNPIYKLASNNLDTATNNDIKCVLHGDYINKVIEIVQAITVFLVILVGIILIKNNSFTVTGLLIVYMYRSNIFWLISSLTSIKDYYVSYKIAANRIFELMDKDKFPKEKYGDIELKNIKGKIELRDLSFAYGKKKVLKNISFVLEPNDTVGIVGESGSGKTTLLNLIAKSYDVHDNQIFIDDIDLNKLSKDSLKNNISVISQSPYLFNLTIRENLELMNDNVTKKDIINACKVAQIHDFIMTLPNKYDTLLGEGGVNLSGGQRQRLAIARALIKKSKIILFDEATSALDNITQSELQKSISNISNDYTIIIVAHRLSTIRNCNKIFVMDKGEIVGCGTHDELIKNNAYYRKLYNEYLN